MATRKVTKLDRVRISELSAVDDPANQHATFLLAKSRDGGSAMTIGFDPFLIQKGRAEPTEPDDGDSGEEDAEDAADQDEDAEDDDVTENDATEHEKAAFRRHQAAAVKKYVTGILKGAGLAGRRVRKGSGADTDGTDMRSAEEQAADSQAVSDVCEQVRPASGESFTGWIARVAEALGVTVDEMYQNDILAAKAVYDARATGHILKRHHARAVHELAKHNAATIPGSRGYYSEWAKIMKSKPELYSEICKDGGSSAFGVAPVPKAADPGFSMIDNGFGGGSNASGTALDRLNATAREIQKSSVTSGKPLSFQQSWAKAAALDPQTYAAMKRGD